MKTVEEIFEEMLSVFREETGAEASAVSDLSVRLYAVAAQVYSLYVQADWLSRQCFPQSAQGSWLDRHAALRGLERRGAVEAEGAGDGVGGDGGEARGRKQGSSARSGEAEGFHGVVVKQREGG